jgi:hypothetical protein
MLNHLRVPSDYFAKHLQKLITLTLSTMVPPSDAAQLIQLLDILQNDSPIVTIQGQNMGLACLHCAFSATQLGLKSTLPESSMHWQLRLDLSTQIQFTSVNPLATASLAAFMSPITTLDLSGNK